MSGPRLGIAAGNELGADAAAEVARQGGNAVDACLASAIMAWVAEPFFASMGGSGFVTVRSPEGAVEVFDGNNAMPLAVPTEPGQGMKRVFLDYSNGMYTGIGGGSVAVPGALAAAHEAWERHGAIEWEALFSPAVKAARSGIGFPRTSAYYLSVTWEPIWSVYDGSRSVFGIDGLPLAEGAVFVQDDLAESLEIVAKRGPEAFYGGELGADIVTAIEEDEGLLALRDLSSYKAEQRAPITAEAFGWRIYSNPPPAVGGAVLAHMLALLDETKLGEPVERLRTIIDAERVAVGYRNERYEEPGEIAGALEEALAHIRTRGTGSASTTHISAADSDGRACSITESNGYGAGVVVHGILLNNTLGEEELNPMGVHGLVPGSRCHSNQAPTVAVGPGVVVALGSPGADRIVGAIAQTIIQLAIDNKSLSDAVAAPRAHLAARPEGEVLCYEPGLPGDRLGFIPRPYDEPHMFFGAVQAASVAEGGSVDAAHDPRRSGGSEIV